VLRVRKTALSARTLEQENAIRSHALMVSQPMQPAFVNLVPPDVLHVLRPVLGNVTRVVRGRACHLSVDLRHQSVPIAWIRTVLSASTTGQSVRCVRQDSIWSVASASRYQPPLLPQQQPQQRLPQPQPQLKLQLQQPQQRLPRPQPQLKLQLQQPQQKLPRPQPQLKLQPQQPQQRLPPLPQQQLLRQLLP